MIETGAVTDTMEHAAVTEGDYTLENEEAWRKVSWVFGITYAVLFGGSLCFQVFVNIANQSTKGFSSDYALVGFVGFFFLLFNQMIGSIDPTTDAGRVHKMDLIFAYVAFVSSSIAFTQTQIYPSHNCLRQTKVTVTALLSFFLFAAILEAYLSVPLKRYTGISLIDLAAFIKAGSSLVKYLFQIRENFINKSV